MKTTDEFLSAAEQRIANYPAVAALYQQGDPRIKANLAAIAAMLSMYSQMQDTAASEPFTMARDVTVLASAAVKGVLPFGAGQRSTLLVTNTTDSVLVVSPGRRLLDPQGRVHVVTVGASVAAQGAASITVAQEVTTTILHQVTESKPFYSIDVPAPDTGYLAAISVVDSLANTFAYRPAFANTEVNERAYTIESDENRQLSVRFGASAIAGYQPSPGEQILVAVTQTEGEISLAANASFVFEYTPTKAESGATIVLTAVLSAGSAPMDIATMREVISYPSLYDESAVYLGEFDFLLRRNLPAFRFLSVWNERVEETVRGANVKNMNTIFVAALMDSEDTSTLQADIKRVIERADDSYKVTFVPVAETVIPITVNLEVPTVYDEDTVRAAARDLILAQYGRESAWAKRGRGRILYKTITKLLYDNVAACQAENADIQVVVSDAATILPESYRYISEASITVTVESPRE